MSDTHEKAFQDLLATEIRFGCLEYDQEGPYYPIYHGGVRFGKSRPSKKPAEVKQ